MDGSQLFYGLDAARVLRNQRRLEMKELDTMAFVVLVRRLGGRQPPIAHFPPPP
jgi:hypothetical protein